MSYYLCIETGQVLPPSLWLRFKLWFWRRPALWWSWPHRVCKHYEVRHAN